MVAGIVKEEGWPQVEGVSDTDRGCARKMFEALKGCVKLPIELRYEEKIKVLNDRP